MTNWAQIQANLYGNTTERVQELSKTILKAKLTRQELESIVFITQSEIMRRKERKESKKIVRMDEYQEKHKSKEPEQVAPPEGQGPGSAAAPPEGESNEGRQ